MRTPNGRQSEIRVSRGRRRRRLKFRNTIRPRSVDVVVAATTPPPSSAGSVLRRPVQPSPRSIGNGSRSAGFPDARVVLAAGGFHADVKDRLRARGSSAGAARQRRARSLLVRDPPTVVLQEDGDVAGFRQQGYEERLASDALSLSLSYSLFSLFIFLFLSNKTRDDHSASASRSSR